jgi:TRAP-type transport system periplasmic protein
MIEVPFTMSLIARSWIVALVLAGTAALASAQTTVRLASPAPLGSVWHKALKQFEADVRTATGGRVVVRVIGAAQDDEATMISNMKIGRQHAASITALGLASVDPAFNIFAIPMFFSSYEEYRTVRARLEPVLKQKLEAKGLVFLNWGDTGWVYLFSKGPVPNVDELKKQRLYTSAGEDQFVQLYKQNGFNPRPLPFTEIQSGLMTGLLDAVPSTPLATLAFQWYRNVPQMLDLGVGPLAGATVIDAKVWNSIDANDRTQILAIAKKTQDALDKDVPQQDDQARGEMVKRGLKVTTPDAAAVRGFREMADKFATSMKGGVVPADIYDQAARERDAFRKSRGTK